MGLFRTPAERESLQLVISRCHSTSDTAGCILCDLKDTEEDRALNILSLPVLFGIRTTCLIAAGLAFVAAILAISHHRFGVAFGATFLLLAAKFPSFLVRKSIGPIVIDSILILPGVLIATGIV